MYLHISEAFKRVLNPTEQSKRVEAVRATALAGSVVAGKDGWT